MTFRSPAVSRMGLLVSLAGLFGVLVLIDATESPSTTLLDVPTARAQDAGLDLSLTDAFPGLTFSRPIYVTPAPGVDDKLFVVEQRGRIYVVDQGEAQPDRALFLDLRTVVSDSGNERGLLGLAFHPGYAVNGRFFVHYNRRSDGATIVAEYASTASRELANATPVRTVLSRSQPYTNHNGGMLAFGPDGMLYLALGDGGSGGDPEEAGQDLGSWLGSILRIDIDATAPYTVPADNPFVSRNGALPEIWAYGLRNPWRFSFDRQTGEMWAGDVGQGQFEEIDLIVKGGNYGWDRLEGNAPFEPESGDPPDPFIPPVHAYPHSQGRSVTGGYVYRGAAIPDLQGVYLFADYVSRSVWGLWRSGQDVNVTRLFENSHQIASFGEDADGEVYVCSFTDGRVYRITAPVTPPPPADELPALLSQTPLFADLPGLVPAATALPYDVRVPLWSDGVDKSRFLVLPTNGALTYRSTDSFDAPSGTWFAKTFSTTDSAGDDVRLETRVILALTDGYAMASYRWRPDDSDADRVDEAESFVVNTADGALDWTFPSRADCIACHTQVSGGLLGVTSRQLARPNRRKSDLIRRWKRQGVLIGDIPAARRRPRHAPLEGRRRLEKRVRGYLDANCAACHRPGAPEPAGLDLRAEVDLAFTGLLDATPQRGDLGIQDARVVAPGAPERSVLLRRLELRGDDAQMPPLGSTRSHERATERVRAWVRRLR